MSHRLHSADTVKPDMSFDDSVIQEHKENLLHQLDDVATRFHGETYPTGQRSLNQQCLFFGQPVVNLPAPPKLISAEKFLEWKNQFKNYAGMNNCSEIINYRVSESWQLAQQENPRGPDDPMLRFAFKRMNSKVVAALSCAVEQVIPDTTALIDAIVTRKSLGDQYDTNDNKLLPPQCNAYELFHEICQQFEQRTIVAALPIFKGLINLQYRENESPTKLFTAFEQMNTQLIQAIGNEKPKAGQILPEQLKVLFMLNALPSSFELEKKMLQDKDMLTMNDIRLTLLRRYDGKQLNSNCTHVDTYGHRGESAHSFTQSTSFHQPKMKRATHGSNNSYHGRTSGQTNRYNSHTRPLNSYTSNRSDNTTHDDNDNHHNMMLVEHDVKHMEHQALAVSTPSFSSDDDPNRIILDSGCTKHTFYNVNAVDNQRTVPPIKMTCASGRTMTIDQLGSVDITPNVTIHDVAVTKGAAGNLMSVSRICDAGYSVTFSATHGIVLDDNNNVILTFTRTGGLYSIVRSIGTPTPLPRAGLEQHTAPEADVTTNQQWNGNSSSQPVHNTRSRTSGAQQRHVAHMAEERCYYINVSEHMLHKADKHNKKKKPVQLHRNHNNDTINRKQFNVTGIGTMKQLTNKWTHTASTRRLYVLRDQLIHQ